MPPGPAGGWEHGLRQQAAQRRELVIVGAHGCPATLWMGVIAPL
jgi:hypothetical protein